MLNIYTFKNSFVNSPVSPFQLYFIQIKQNYILFNCRYILSGEILTFQQVCIIFYKLDVLYLFITKIFVENSKYSIYELKLQNSKIIISKVYFRLCFDLRIQIICFLFSSCIGNKLQYRPVSYCFCYFLFT